MAAAFVFALSAAVAPAIPTSGGPAPVAAAHSILVKTSPERDSTVKTPPKKIELTFNENVSKDYAHVTLMRDGNNLAQDEPRVEGRTVSLTAPDLEPGTYLVGYRVVSADGHPIQGSWEFTVGDASGAGGEQSRTATGNSSNSGSASGNEATAQQDSGQATNEAPPAAQEAKENSSQWPIIVMIGVLAVLLIAGAAVMIRRQKKTDALYANGNPSARDTTDFS